MAPYMSSDSHQLLRANDSHLGDIRDVGYMQSNELLEIYSVQILNTYNNNHVNLYGTIVADEDLEPYYYYNRDRSNPEKIGPNEFLKLIDPPRAMHGGDIFDVDLNLMADDSPFPKNVLNNGGWSWHPLLSDFDVVESEVLKGPYCSVAFTYAVFSCVVQANVEVTFINKGGENCANVYGTIHAFNTRVTIPTLLF